MRGADGGPFSALCALPVFWVHKDELSLVLLYEKRT